MFNYTNCPICKNKDFKHFITCKDHTVSGESFNIVECTSCSFKFTNPIPDLSQLGNYYKSEDYISHSDTRKGLISRLYHIVRKYTLKRKIKLISGYVSRGTILDYGCGTGAFLKACNEVGWKSYGLEPDAGAREVARKGGVNACEDKKELSGTIGNVQLSAITLWHVLEHVIDLEETLAFFREKLIPQGVLIIAVPNHISHDAKHYKAFWAAYDVPRHLYHFEPKTMEQLLNGAGFDLIQKRPMKFDSYYVSMLSEKYKSGHTNYFKAFTRGFFSNLAAISAGNYSSVIYVFKKK